MIEICYTFDSNYIQHVAASIHSLFKYHNKDEIKFHLLYSSVSKSKLKVLTKWIDIQGYDYKLYAIEPQKFNNCPLKLNDRLTRVAYYRIALSSVLPKECTKVLYLDPDTIIQSNLSDLFDTDISSYSLGAVCMLDNYFNSGVLLINLDYWRKHNIQDMFFQSISSNSSEIDCHDQDVLNNVLAGTWFKLQLKYNAGNNIFRILNRSKANSEPLVYKDEEIREAKENPVIIHYAGSFHYKPWYKNCIHWWQNLYLENLRETPYKNYKLKYHYILDLMKKEECPYHDIHQDIYNIVKDSFSIKKKYSPWNLFVRKMYLNRKKRNFLFDILSLILFYKKTFKFNTLQKVEPVQVIIDISGYCNAKCPFCIRQLSECKSQMFMKKEIFYEIIKQIKQIKSIKVISLSAYGEPLLHPDFDEFVHYLRKLKYNVLVTTNMSLAHKHFDSLLELTHIMFSVEGWDKESYEKYRQNLCFEKVYSNIKEFDKLVNERRLRRRHTPSRTINFLLTKKSKIKKFLSLWQPYSDLIHFGLMKNPLVWNNRTMKFETVESSLLKDEIIPLLNKNNTNSCIQPFNVISINPNGDVKLCCNDSNCNFDFGSYKNIKKSFFSNKFFNTIRQELARKKIYICENCSWNYDTSIDYLKKYLPELNEISINNKYL
ncbi:MAG: radical SAM protein [Candidatus Gastranaerophilales bacterium]|nr:radical SAM protein [Candidatus Gastranaerophilales bacterium]